MPYVVSLSALDSSSIHIKNHKALRESLWNIFTLISLNLFLLYLFIFYIYLYLFIYLFIYNILSKLRGMESKTIFSFIFVSLFISLYCYLLRFALYIFVHYYCDRFIFTIIIFAIIFSHLRIINPKINQIVVF